MRSPFFKLSILSILFFTSHLAVVAQPEWFRQFESDQTINLSRFCEAPDGTWYAIASFKGNTDFDPGPGTNILTAETGPFSMWSQFALVHFTANGELIWVKSFNTFGNLCFFTSMSISPQGDLVLSGYHEYQVDLEPGPGETLSTSFSNAPGEKGFLLRLNTDGDLQSVAYFRVLSTSSDAKTMDVVYTSTGEKYVVMNIAGEADLDPSEAVVEVSTAGGSGGLSEMVLLKLNAEDSLLWFKKWAPTTIASIKLNAVELDSNGYVYVGGFVHETVDLNPGEDTLWVDAKRDPVVISLNADGEYLWSRIFPGSPALKTITNIQLYNDSLVFAGFFYDTLNTDTSANALQFVSNGQQDIFLGKMDLQGNLGWIKAFGSSGPEEAFNLQITGEELVISGFFNAPLDFDPGMGNVTQSPVGSFDLYVLSLNHAGDFERLYTRGSPGSDFAGFGRTEGPYYLIAGFTDSTLVLNPSPAEASIVSAAGRDAFFARFIPSEVNVVSQSAPDKQSLYPNPSKGLIQVSGLTTPAQIRVYDTFGRCLGEFVCESSHPISLSHCPNGVYIVEVKTLHDQTFHKIILE